MGRFARVVIPNCPHHVTQRGNYRKQVFLSDSECRFYLTLLKRNCSRYGVKLPAYCLMPNHVHDIAIPKTRKSLSLAIGRTHNDFARWVHMQRNLTGHLWQNRFFSCPMDDDHFWEALRYIELNPVRAKLVKHAWEWPWSSARAHITGEDETGLVDMDLWKNRFNRDEWRSFLEAGQEDCFNINENLRRATRTGRPLGSEEFVTYLEKITGRKLARQRVGRKPLNSTKSRGKK